jgi:cellulose synthase/poly-beta-1,6-N-acetylglucosamine synthase-like glycosyltransferase
MLPAKIRHLLDIDYKYVNEIVIVSDGSDDGTAELLVNQRHPRIVPVVLEQHVGKAAAINAGVARATAEVIVFIDIRPEVAPNAIQQLVSNFADENVGCVSGNLQLRFEGHNQVPQAVGGFYWRYEQWIRTCESITDSPVGVYGGFYAIRRKLFVPQPSGTILDDMFEPLSIIRQGYRSVVDPSAFVVDIWPKTPGAEFNRKVRTLAGNFQLIQLAPWLLGAEDRVLFQLVSHKLLRLAVPYLLVALLLSSVVLLTHSVLYAVFAVAQIGVWALAVVGLRWRIPVIDRIGAPAGALLMLNAAAVVGLYKFLFTRGPLWKIWVSTAPVTVRTAGTDHVMTQ